MRECDRSLAKSRLWSRCPLLGKAVIWDLSVSPEGVWKTRFLRKFAVELDLVPSSVQKRLKTAQSRDSVVDLVVNTAGSRVLLSL